MGSSGLGARRTVGGGEGRILDANMRSTEGGESEVDGNELSWPGMGMS